MIDLSQNPRSHDPLEARISRASDSIQPSIWLPPQWAQIPRIRLGTRRINVPWILRISFVVLVPGIAVCQGLYDSPWFHEFVARYPRVDINLKPVHFQARRPSRSDPFKPHIVGLPTGLHSSRYGSAARKTSGSTPDGIQRVDLSLAIIAINGWNRVAIPFRSTPGTYRPRQATKQA